MRLIIEAHLVDDEGSTARIQLSTIDRASTTDPLGMSLAEGKALLAAAQQYLVNSQCQGIASAHAHCERCDARLGLKGWHQRQIKTVFGLVNVQSPRVRHCRCANKPAGASFSPLTLVVPTSMTPELEYLQVKWAAHLSYAAATALLSEVLPTADTISVSGVQRRVRVVGAALEHESSRAALSVTGAQHDQEPAQLAALAVDSAWLKHCHPYPHQGRHVNLVAGRACFEGGKTRLYAYVHNQVASAATRLDQFLTASGVGQNDRVTIFTDGAGEFAKAVHGASWPTCRILDWFHIAMKFRAIDLTAGSRRDLLAPSGRNLCEEIASCKWLVWHGKATKAVARLKHICKAFEMVAGEPFFTLWMNLDRLIGYLESNDRYLVNYRRRHYKGLPISSSIAESAVNEVVSWRMAKKRQMRWSDEGAHLLAQVRVRAINGDLYPRAFATPLRPPKPFHKPSNDAYFVLKAA